MDGRLPSESECVDEGDAGAECSDLGLGIYSSTATDPRTERSSADSFPAMWR